MLRSDAKPGGKLAGYSSAVIESVSVGYECQVRHLDVDHQDTLVAAAIRQFAESYGSRKKISDEVLAECIELIIDHFGKIGLIEIRTAYQLWAMRVINGAEMWGGEFNALQLGRVLSDYVQYRQKVVNQFITRRDEITERERKERERIDKTQATINNFPQELNKARANSENRTWQQVLGNWYKLAEYHGYLQLTEEEKRPYWEQGKKQARIEIEAEVNRLFKSKRNTEARAHKKEYEGFSDSFIRRAKAIAEKMIVHELLICKQ